MHRIYVVLEHMKKWFCGPWFNGLMPYIYLPLWHRYVAGVNVRCVCVCVCASGLSETENDMELVTISKLDRWNKHFAFRNRFNLFDWLAGLEHSNIKCHYPKSYFSFRFIFNCLASAVLFFSFVGKSNNKFECVYSPLQPPPPTSPRHT